MSNFLGKVGPPSSTTFQIYRMKITDVVLAHTDFVSEFVVHDIVKFVNNVAIFRNGQLLFNGKNFSEENNNPVEVYPNGNNIRFAFDLLKGDTIQIITGG